MREIERERERKFGGEIVRGMEMQSLKCWEIAKHTGREGGNDVSVEISVDMPKKKRLKKNRHKAVFDRSNSAS